MKLRCRRCIFISADVVISTFRCNRKYSSGAQTLWWEYICVYVTRLQCAVVAFNSDYTAFSPFKININSYGMFAALLLKCYESAKLVHFSHGQWRAIITRSNKCYF